jgi:proteasome lid subunit RPN8/RPN11
VCGVLAGRRVVDGGGDGAGGGGREDDGDEGGESAACDRVTAVRRVPNVAENPRVAYELDPEETLSAIESLEAEGLDLVGFYHSHPETEPVPSRTDRERATWTGYVYLICSPDGRANAFRWTGSAFDRLRLAFE